MKRAILRMVGKSILTLSSFFWNRKKDWTFKLNQKLTWIALDLNHKYNLNLWDEDDSDKDPNRF